MTTETDDKRFADVRHRISDWLLAEGWRLTDMSAKAEGAAWALEATDPNKRVVVFGQGETKPDALVMQAPINIDEPSQARLAALGPEKNEELGWEIRFQLINMGVKFSGLTLPIKRFVLVSRVYADELGRNDFFERVDRLQDAIIATIWMIRRSLAEPAPDSAGADALGIN
jgi:hypothetical protein